MPLIESTCRLNCSTAELFAFLLSPRHFHELSPPDAEIALVDPPEMLEAGTRITMKARRWSISQQVEMAVVHLQTDSAMVIEQTKGPFKKWVHHHELTAAAFGTVLAERIDYEPPGGMLGAMLAGTFIDRQIQTMLEFRRRRFEELFGKQR